MGCIGGGIWHSIRGARLAPSGSRMIGSITAVQARSPVLGGQFAVWGGIFACCDCSLTAIRQKEDPWNSIASGAATGGILAARAGPRAMASAAVVGGVLLGLIEGMGIMLNRMLAPPVPTADDYAALQQAATAPPTQGGLMGMINSASGSAPPPSSPPPDSLAPPTHEPFVETDGVTTFSTETSDSKSNTASSGGWWPFGGEESK